MCDSNEFCSTPLGEDWELYTSDAYELEPIGTDETSFLVPIFAIEDNTKTFRGNGVIVGQYLVTAAHVAQSEDGLANYDELCFTFEGKSIFVTDDDLVFDGRGKVNDKGYNNDLIVYKLNDIVSEIACNEAEVQVGTKMFSWRCQCFEEKVQFSGGGCSIVSLETKDDYGDKIWKNCFKVDFSSQIVPGNSGSGVFVKDVLYGLLVEVIIGHEAYGKVLDARYIKQCINEY